MTRISSCPDLCRTFVCAVLRERGTQAQSLVALIQHQFTHSKHKCGGKLDVFGREQCPVVTG